MSTSMRRRVLLVALLPLPILLAIAGILAWQLERVRESSHWVEHTDEVLSEMHLAERLLIDQETGLRGFLLTRNAVFLEPYTRGTQEYPVTIEHVRALTADNPGQQQRLAVLYSAYQLWLQSASEEMHPRRDRLESHMLLRKQSMDGLRAQLGIMTDQERLLLRSRQETARSTQKTGLLTSLAVLGVAAIFLVWLMRRSAEEIENTYHAALEQESRSRAAAQALASEVAEQSQQMEVLYKEVRSDRDQARRRVEELEGTR